MTDQPTDSPGLPKQPACAIVLLRGQRVILDVDLAELYGVPVKSLVRAVKRNLDPGNNAFLQMQPGGRLVIRGMPLRQIITEEMQLRFSSMQIDVFALLTEARRPTSTQEQLARATGGAPAEIAESLSALEASGAAVRQRIENTCSRIASACGVCCRIGALQR